MCVCSECVFIAGLIWRVDVCYIYTYSIECILVGWCDYELYMSQTQTQQCSRISRCACVCVRLLVVAECAPIGSIGNGIFRCGPYPIHTKQQPYALYARDAAALNESYLSVMVI